MSTQPAHEIQTMPDDLQLFVRRQNSDGTITRTFRFDAVTPSFEDQTADSPNQHITEGNSLSAQEATIDIPAGEVMSDEDIAVQRAQETLNAFTGTVKSRDSQVSTKIGVLLAEQTVLEASKIVAQETIDRLGAGLQLAGTAVKQREGLLNDANEDLSQAESAHEEQSKTPIGVVDDLMLALAAIKANILNGGTETVADSEAHFTTIRSTVESLHNGTFVDGKGVPHRLIELVTTTAIAMDDVRIAQQARDFEQASLEQETAQRDAIATELDNFVQQLNAGKELLGGRMRMTEYYDKVATSDKTLVDRLRTAWQSWLMQRRGELPVTDDFHLALLPNVDTQQAITDQTN